MKREGSERTAKNTPPDRREERQNSLGTWDTPMATFGSRVALGARVTVTGKKGVVR